MSMSIHATNARLLKEKQERHRRGEVIDMDKIQRERRTEDRVRAMDAAEIVEWIHLLEDTALEWEDRIAELEAENKALHGLRRCPKDIKRIKELKSILELALNQQLANRGTKHEFYICYTFDHGNFPTWVTESKKALQEQKDE